ncbi:MAG: carbon-nitrogen family hydrolase [Desulfotalea sp.]
MRVAIVQIASVDGDVKANIKKVRGYIDSCNDSDLIILPELWNIGFNNFSQYQSWAENKSGPTLTMLREMAVLKGVYIHTGSFVEEENGCFYNSSYLLGKKGDILANYRKIHLFPFGSLEGELLNAGDEVVTVQTEIGCIGLATCFDLRFPELFRSMVSKGAELFLVCAAWPAARNEHWQMFTKVRAIENQCYLIGANSAGTQGQTILAGRSVIVSPEGNSVDFGTSEGVFFHDINMDIVAENRKVFPSLASRTTWL